MSTATTTAPTTAAPRHREPPGAVEPFAGTGWLVRLMLRLDRVRIPAWALSFLALVAGSVASLEATYPTAESLQARAALMDNPAAVLMTGPAFALDDYTFGAMVANELSLWIFAPAAVMSVLLAVRHTRGEEESGRLEVVRALPVGRLAAPSAALVTVAVANLAVALAVAVALVGTGMEPVDSVAFAVATGLTGLVFGGVAAVAAQVTEHARAASGAGLGAVALAFLVRGIGDVIDDQGSWLSWLSPFAWAQQTRLYVDLRWWPLVLPAVATVALLALAASLARRRDLGAGLRPPSPGPAEARPSLLSPAGLARRLTTSTFAAWAVGLVLFAVAFGTLATALDGMLDEIPVITDWIPLDLEDVTRSFAAVMLSILGIGPPALLVWGVLQLRGEEQAGRLEGLLVSGSSRTAVLAGWCATVTLWALAALVLLGLGVGVGVMLATGDAGWVVELTAASLAYVPATLLHGAVAVALVGLLPRWSALAWAPVLWSGLVVWLGGLLDLPDWAAGLAPLARTPLVPGVDLAWTPLLVMAALAVLLSAAGVVGLRRRDLPR